MTKKVFVDTNILLSPIFDFNNYEKVYLSIVTVEELDGLKKSDEVGYLARRASNNIENANNKEIILFNTENKVDFLEHKNDNTILSMAFNTYLFDKEVIFLTDDLNLKFKAESLKLPCERYKFKDENFELYKGYKEVTLSEYEQAVHYECPINKWNLLNNEYLIIKNEDGEVIDKQCWTEKGFRPVIGKPFKSMYLGDIKAKDVYQQLAIDSLTNSQFTILTGAAGSAKSLLSLAYIMQQIQNNKINKCVVIFNPVKLKNNEQLGYYSGTRTEKLLQNSIGGILSSKLGDMIMVETLISQGKLMIIPTSDIRGIEISERDCILVTEAQNTDSYTMKTILQRATEGCKVIVEGDVEEQQDIKHCSKRDNGMLKAINTFKGSDLFSCVKLQNIYRSKLADIAQSM